MEKILLPVFLLMLAGCASTIDYSADDEFKIVSFAQGKMTRVSGKWEIYEPGSQLQVQDNGFCVFNRRRIPCMWHGYIIEYESAGDGVELTCRTNQDMPVDVGNPNELLARDSTEFEYNLLLPAGERIFINPQYVTQGGASDVSHSFTICKLNGEPVLKFKQDFIYGGSPQRT